MNTLLDTKVNKDGICNMVLDMPGTSANVLNKTMFDAINAELDAIEKNPDIKALVISSAKPKVFVAGADLNAFFSDDITEADIDKMIRLGQDTFNRINRLTFTTVAAIHGACLGGGLELSLACDYRISSNDKATKIGLPEVMLGILPAWGGSTRLPRLIGLPSAVEAILSGKAYAAMKAKKMGIVDKVVFKENLIKNAMKMAKMPKRKEKFHATNLRPVNWIVEHMAKKNTLGKTLGNYPAPIRALEVITDGLKSDIKSSLKSEREAILDLMHTEATRNLIRIFFLQERAKKLKVDTGDAPNMPAIQNTTVIGAGIMGSGIAQWVSSRGMHVLLKDISEDQLAGAVKRIKGLYHNAAKRRIMTQAEAQAGIDRVVPMSKDVPLSYVDLVIEAAVEQMDIKKKLLVDLESKVHDDTIIATNTSALSITEIADVMKRPDKLVGIHFFNPVHRMKLVEVVVGEKTSKQTASRSVDFVKKIGKLPVLVKDSPGFLVNRILVPYLLEAVQLFQAGADVDMIDKVMKRFGMPMGPLRLIDEVGLDVSYHVGVDLANRLPHVSCDTALLDKLIETGSLGRKSKIGFYQYGGGKKPDVNIALEPLRDLNALSKIPDAKEVEERLSLLMVNEGARCLQEGVVEDPRDVDFGMIMGTGWAPFRGGPLRFADHYGICKLVDRLHDYAARYGAMYEPANILVDMAKNNKVFNRK